MLNMLMCPWQVKTHIRNVFFKLITRIYQNINILIKYFDIIAEIHRPSPKVQPCEQTSRDTDDQIPENVTLTKYLSEEK